MSDLFELRLNMMRDRHERMDTIAIGTRAELDVYLAREKVEPYSDPGPSAWGGETSFNKVYRKGGPLEWYNPPDDRSFAPFPSLEEHMRNWHNVRDRYRIPT